MPENSTLIQLNFKPTSTMINAYCGDEAEIDEALGLIEKNAGRIMQTEVLLTDAAKAAGAISQGGAAPRPSNAPAPVQGQPAQNAGPSKQCAHGEMNFVSGMSQKTGKPWKAWDCPAKGQANACQPDRQFVR